METLAIIGFILFVGLFYKLIRYMEKKENQIKVDSLTRFHEGVEKRTTPQK